MEYKTRVNDTKRAAVAQLKEEFGKYSGFIFADYRGLTVAELTSLRRRLREKNAACRVVKNHYARIAFKELGHEGFDEQMTGPTAIVLANGEEQNVIAKIVMEAAKESGNKMSVRGALLDGMHLDAAGTEAFSKLPGRLDLISMLMATMKAPVQKLAATLLAYRDKLESGSAGNASQPSASDASKEEASSPAESAAPQEG